MSFNSASIIHCRFIKNRRENAARLGNFPFHCLQSFYRITSIKWEFYSFCNQTNHQHLSSFSFWLNWTMIEVHLIGCLRQEKWQNQTTKRRGKLRNCFVWAEMILRLESHTSILFTFPLMLFEFHFVDIYRVQHSTKMH